MGSIQKELNAYWANESLDDYTVKYFLLVVTNSTIRDSRNFLFSGNQKNKETFEDHSEDGFDIYRTSA
jgi:hypothetical protein